MINDKHKIIDKFQHTQSLSITGAHKPVFVYIEIYFVVKKVLQ